MGVVYASHYARHGNPIASLTTQRWLLGWQEAGRGEGGRDGEVEQGEGDGVPLRPAPALLGALRLLPGDPVLHAYPGVDRLVPPEVVVVLELLAADGTDVGHACWPGRRLHR